MPVPAVLASLETIDKPPPASPDLASTPAFPSSSIRRVSRLPPAPTVPLAGLSSESQRYLFIAVRRGHRVGVYSRWEEVEREVSDYPDPVFKTFSTRLAAEAFIVGWDGAGRHSLPGSSPRPLREHLAMNFPASVPSSSSSTRRPSYHARLLSTLSPSPAEEGFSPSDISTMPNFYDRPPLKHSMSSVRSSLVRVPSPLRAQVDDDEQGRLRPTMKKATSLIGVGGLLSPPSSPGDSMHRSAIHMERSTKPRNATEAGRWASSQHRNFPGIGVGLGLLSPPSSPPLLATEKRKTSTSNLRAASTSSGLWAAALPVTPSPLTPEPIPDVELVDSPAPKFSRSGLKKSGVIMPVAAPRTNSSSSLRKVPSRASLLSPSSSSTSLGSSSSNRSTRTVRRVHSSQDRLSSFAETTQRELLLNEEGLLALSALSPPRPAFMRKTSTSSLSSDASGQSMGSLTSASSILTPSVESCDPITEEDVQISCTKSDGDADGSVESSSMKSGISKEKKRKGGLFKRFSQAIGLENKDSVRRPSL